MIDFLSQIEILLLNMLKLFKITVFFFKISQFKGTGGPPWFLQVDIIL